MDKKPRSALWVGLIVMTGLLMGMQVQSPDTMISVVAWSPDGNWIAYVVNGEVTLYDSVSNTPLIIDENLPTRVTAIAWHPHESTLALATEDGFIHIYTLEANAPFQKQATLNHGIGYDPDGFALGVRELAWSFDGLYLASASVMGNYTLQIWSTQDWTALLRVGAGTGISFDWSPRKNLLTITNLDELRLLEMEKILSLSTVDVTDWNLWASLTTRITLPEHLKLMSEPAFSTDGQRIAFASITGELWIYDLSTDRVDEYFRLEQIPASNDWIMARHIEWSFDDNALYVESGYASRNGGTSRILVLDRANKSVIQNVETHSTYNQFALSPYGGRIVYVDAAVKSDLTYFVPRPSLDRLNAIMRRCGAPIKPLESLDAFSNFIPQVESLPEGAIPTACRADLLAVADALK